MNISYASEIDFDFISNHDNHIAKEELLKLILDNKIIIAKKNESICGWLRYNLFWDNTPFMNMLYLLENERGKGNGRKLVEFWESEMKKLGHNLVMTSTQADEQAQFFYRKLDYVDSGCLLLKTQPLEIILTKEI